MPGTADVALLNKFQKVGRGSSPLCAAGLWRGEAKPARIELLKLRTHLQHLLRHSLVFLSFFKFYV